MTCGRYQVRVFESVEGDQATAPDTTLTPCALAFSIYAYSADEAEKIIEQRVAAKKLAAGRVYQIWPLLGNGEFTRSIAIPFDGPSQRVLLDPAGGPYSELRRIRLPRQVAAHTESVDTASVSA